MKPLIHTWTSLETYENCPFSSYHKNVIRSVPYVETEENKWGNEVHAALEKAALLRKNIEGRFECYRWISEAFLKAKGELRPEVKLGVRRDFSSCDFFDDDVWIRGKEDLVIDYGNWALAWDYKTGKEKKTLSKQLMFAALKLFAKFPRFDKIITQYVWLQTKHLSPPETYYRAQIPELWGHFLPLIQEIEECYERDIWYKKQNGLCKAWCPVHICEYNGRYLGK